MMFKYLGYDTTDKISTLITFDSATEVHTKTIGDLAKFQMTARGQTFMSNAISQLTQYITRTNPKQLRILTISDGEVQDQEATIRYPSEHSSRSSGLPRNGM